MKRTYIKPSLYSKKIVCSHILADSLDKSSSDTTGGFGAKQDNGFNWSGRPTWEDDEEDGI